MGNLLMRDMRQFGWSFFLLATFVGGFLDQTQAQDVSASTEQHSSAPAQSSEFVCPMTAPNGRVYSAAELSRVEGLRRWLNDWDGKSGRALGNYGNEALATALSPDGTIVFKPGGPGFVLEDGSLSMKFPWWRLVKARLTIEGRRLDQPAAPLRASIPDGYGDIGFQATAVIFPTPGCWEVTGRVAGKTLSFVTLVEKIGEGPVQSRRPEL